MGSSVWGQSLGARRVSIARRQAAGGMPNSRLKRSEEHTSELQSRLHLVCRLLLEKKKKQQNHLLLRYNWNDNILLHNIYTKCTLVANFYLIFSFVDCLQLTFVQVSTLHPL